MTTVYAHSHLSSKHCAGKENPASQAGNMGSSYLALSKA